MRCAPDTRSLRCSSASKSSTGDTTAGSDSPDSFPIALIHFVQLNSKLEVDKVTKYWNVVSLERDDEDDAEV